MRKKSILLIFDVLQLIDHNVFQEFVFLVLQLVNDSCTNQATKRKCFSLFTIEIHTEIRNFSIVSVNDLSRSSSFYLNKTKKVGEYQ